MTGGDQPDTRATLFVRASAPGPARDRQEECLDRLRRLEAAGRLSLSVETWESEVPMDGPVGSARDRYAEFTRWASDREAVLTPFFEVRERTSLVDSERREVLSLPVLCLAVYDGDDLRAVYPHADGEDVYSVPDGIDALASEGVEAAATPDLGIAD